MMHLWAEMALLWYVKAAVVALVVLLFGYFAFRRFSNKLRLAQRLAQLKLLWRRGYLKAAVVVVALLAVGGYIALKPTYSADEVTKKLETYLERRVYSQSSSLSDYSTFRGGKLNIDTQTTSCYQLVRAEGLATPHYIPYRKAWRITSVSSLGVGRDVVTGAVTRENITWLFDERTGTIASSDSRC